MALDLRTAEIWNSWRWRG